MAQFFGGSRITWYGPRSGESGLLKPPSIAMKGQTIKRVVLLEETPLGFVVFFPKKNTIPFKKVHFFNMFQHQKKNSQVSCVGESSKTPSTLESQIQ